MSILPTITVIIGLFLAGGTLFFIAALMIPAVIRITIERHAQKTKCWVSIGPVGGLVGLGVGTEEGVTKAGVCIFAWRLATFHIFKRRPPIKPAVEQEVAEKEARYSPEKGMSWLREGVALMKPVMRLFRSSLRAMTIRQVICSGWFGCEDPATTGMVFGWLQGIRGIIHTKHVVLALSPDFERQRFEGTVSLVVNVHVLRIGASIIRFLYRLIEIGVRHR